SYVLPPRFTQALTRARGDRPLVVSARQLFDSPCELGPFTRKTCLPPSARRSELIVFARRPCVGFSPRRGQRAIALQPTQQRIDRPLGARQLRPAAERRQQVVAIARLTGYQGEHTPLEQTATDLGEPLGVRVVLDHGYSVAHSTLLCK